MIKAENKIITICKSIHIQVKVETESESSHHIEQDIMECLQAVKVNIQVQGTKYF